MSRNSCSHHKGSRIQLQGCPCRPCSLQEPEDIRGAPDFSMVLQPAPQPEQAGPPAESSSMGCWTGQAQQTLCTQSQCMCLLVPNQTQLCLDLPTG